MPATLQLMLPFACLDFPDRSTVTVSEIAGKIGVSCRHVLDHIESGALLAVDTRIGATKSNMRVPVDEYRRWVLARLTGPARRTFLAELPPQMLRELAAEIRELLAA